MSTALRIKDLPDAEQALTELGRRSLPVPLMMRVFKLRKQVRAGLELAQEARDALVNELGIDDGNGNKTIRPGGRNWDQANRQLKELERQRIEMSDTLPFTAIDAEFQAQLNAKKASPDETAKLLENLSNILFGLHELLEYDEQAAA